MRQKIYKTLDIITFFLWVYIGAVIVFDLRNISIETFALVVCWSFALLWSRAISITFED